MAETGDSFHRCRVNKHLLAENVTMAIIVCASLLNDSTFFFVCIYKYTLEGHKYLFHGLEMANNGSLCFTQIYV